MGPLLKNLLRLIVLMAPAFLSAQNIRQAFSFHHLTEKNGLSNNIVNCIIKDKQGFLWIGTYDGLNRFDGLHFNVYKNNRRDSQTLINNTVHQLCEDRKGNIWAATEDGISCWQSAKGQFSNYSLKNIPGASGILNILCDHQGNIWASGKNGLLLYDSAQNNFINYRPKWADALPFSQIIAYKNGILEDPMHRGIWLTTYGGISYFDFNKKEFTGYRNNTAYPELFNDHTVSAIAKTDNGQLLYFDNTMQQIIQLDPATYQVQHIPVGNNSSKKYEASTLLKDAAGNIWMSSWTYDLLFLDAKKGLQPTAFFNDESQPNSIAGNFFWSARQDEEGTIWLGTVGGISYTNNAENTFEVYEVGNKLASLKKSQGLYTLTNDEDNSWWIGTSKNGLLHYYPDNDSIVVIPSPRPINKKFPNDQVSIYSVVNLNGRMYVGTTEGPYLFNKTTKTFSRLKGLEAYPGLNTQAVTFIIKQNDSIAWLRPFRNGLYRYNYINDTWKHYGDERDSLIPGGKLITEIFVDNNKNLWTIAMPATVTFFDEARQQFQSFDANTTGNNIGKGSFVNAVVDRFNNIWIASKGAGLIRFDTRTHAFKRWNESDNLAFDHIMAITMDKAGKVWTAGYNKISVFDTLQNRFLNFSLPISEGYYDYLNHFKKLPDGRLLLSINSSIVLIDPSKINGIQTNRKTLINGLSIQDRSKYFDPANAQIDLQHFENFFTISFALITATDPNRYHFVYQLEGYNTSWVDAGSNGIASYTNIPGGDYVFRVKAVSNAGLWEAAEARLNIKVIPPFYKTSWFFAIITVLTALLIFGLIRLRINAIRKVAQQKTETNRIMNEWQLKALRAQMNPHFIFNCLNSIDNYILKNDEENASRYLNKFSKLVRLILNQSDATSTTLSKELEMLKYYMELEQLRFDEPFAFKIEVAPGIDVDETEIPSMLLQPYVENAILHGLKHKDGNGSLKIKIDTVDDTLHCVIEDNGIGREKAAAIKKERSELHISKATNITEQRIKMMQVAGEGDAAVKINDLVNEQGEPCGTSVEISVPYLTD